MDPLFLFYKEHYLIFLNYSKNYYNHYFLILLSSTLLLSLLFLLSFVKFSVLFTKFHKKDFCRNFDKSIPLYPGIKVNFRRGGP